MVAGSPLWQTIFIFFALALIAIQVLRGWRLGVVRQIVRLLALLSAYAVAFFGGKMLLPLLRPLLRVPDIFITVGAGAVLAILVYWAINLIGALLFKSTAQQPAGPIRFLYGLAGAALGVIFGLIGVWLMVVAVRCAGSIANAQLHRESAQAHGRFATARADGGGGASESPMITSLAKLQNSIELGSLGKVVRSADVMPDRTYRTLGKLGSVVSNPESASRFLSYPGASHLSENPKIAALRDDPEVMELIRAQRYLDLLQNPRVIEALNDPTLAAEVRSFDFQKALDYAMGTRTTSH